MNNDIEKEIKERGYRVSTQEIEHKSFWNLISYNDEIVHTAEIENEFDVDEYETFLREGLQEIDEQIEIDLDKLIIEGNKQLRKEAMQTKVEEYYNRLKSTHYQTRNKEKELWEAARFDEYYAWKGGREVIMEIIKELEEILK